MHSRFIAVIAVIGVAVGAGWYVFAQPDEPEVPNPLAPFIPNSVLSTAQLNAIVDRINAIIALINAEIDEDMPRTIAVDCNAGGTIGQALQDADDGDTLQISGTCNERVTVFLDGITLVGQDGAVIDGGGGFVPTPVGFPDGVITIVGARGVVIDGLTVQNGPDGITGSDGASFIVRNVTAQGNADDGINVRENSTAEISNCTAQDNGDDGFHVSNSSSVIFQGTITSTGNADDGIHIIFGSSGMLAPGVIVSANNNGNSATFGAETFDGLVIGDGIRISGSSQLVAIGGNIIVETRGNGDAGISVNRASNFGAFGSSESGAVTITSDGNVNGGVRALGTSFFNVTGSNATLTVSNNGTLGIDIVDSSAASLDATVLIQNHPTGAIVRQSSSMRLFSAVNIMGNNNGLFVSEGSSASLASTSVINNGNVGVVVDDGSATISNTTITGNAVDILAAFGSRLILNGSTIGTVSCDQTVLSRGDRVCDL